ncbi:unnamed protein product, partial [Ilex paraguariensis]
MAALEALAMAGVDFEDCNLTFEEYERQFMLQPPPYLLAKPRIKRKTSCNCTVNLCLLNLHKGKVCNVDDEICADDDREEVAAVAEERCSGEAKEGGKENTIRKGWRLVRTLMKRIVNTLANMSSKAKRKP